MKSERITDARRAQSSGARLKAGERTELQRSGPKGSGPAPLDSALKAFLRASGIGEKLGPWAMFQAFSEAAGPAFSRHARAVRFARGELLVEVDSASHLAELKGFRGEEIRARTNQIHGREDIRRIAFRAARLDSPASSDPAHKSRTPPRRDSPRPA